MTKERKTASRMLSDMRETAIEMLSEKALRVVDARGERWLADDVYIADVWAEAERRAEREFRDAAELAASVLDIEGECPLMHSATEEAYRQAVLQTAYAQEDADNGAPSYIVGRLRERYANVFGVGAFGVCVRREQFDADVDAAVARNKEEEGGNA